MLLPGFFQPGYMPGFFMVFIRGRVLCEVCVINILFRNYLNTCLFRLVLCQWCLLPHQSHFFFRRYNENPYR